MTKNLKSIKFNYKTVVSARFDKQDEDDQVLHEIEIYFSLNMNQNSTRSEIDNIDVGSHLQQLVQNEESKDSGCRNDKVNEMTKYFYRTAELNGQVM